jgi:hypothetical protein
VDVGIRLFFIGLAFGGGVCLLGFGLFVQQEDAVSIGLKAAFCISMLFVANSLIRKLKKFGIRS